MSVYLSIEMPSVFPVTCHTDYVGKGSYFIAIEGYTENGISYIKKAIEKGADKIIVQQDSFLDDDLLSYMRNYNVILDRVANTRKALAELSAQAAHFPAHKLKFIGITGTTGKTTTSFLLEHVLRSTGYKTALISSVKNSINNFDFLSPLTTPQPDYLQQFLKLCVDNNVEYVVMEVAAQALTLHRVDGINFCGVIFTNFSQEHLEFYPTLEDYFNAKRLIFTMCRKDAPVVINGDDEQGIWLLDHYKHEQQIILKSYGFKNNQYDFIGFSHEFCMQGLKISLQDQIFECPALFGLYNAYNILACVSMSLQLGIAHDVIIKALKSFTGVSGRLQRHMLPNGAQCFIDYAYNAESFKAVLSTLRIATNHLIVVFGAGGDRDKLKRPMMGYVAASIADIIIITSDNPRSEDAAAIAADIIQGIPESLHYKIIQELDRKKAIEQAYFLSDQNSIIALLGKGPDEYQIIGRIKHYFSEQKILEQL